MAQGGVDMGEDILFADEPVDTGGAQTAKDLGIDPGEDHLEPGPARLEDHLPQGIDGRGVNAGDMAHAQDPDPRPFFDVIHRLHKGRDDTEEKRSLDFEDFHPGRDAFLIDGIWIIALLLIREIPGDRLDVRGL